MVQVLCLYLVPVRSYSNSYVSQLNVNEVLLDYWYRSWILLLLLHNFT